MSRHRFLLAPDRLAADTILLENEELRHLRARRIEVGERVVLGDGDGQERDAVVEEVSRTSARLRALSPLRACPRHSPRLVLVQAVLKGDKLDWVVEKATEIGVDEIHLFESERVVGAVSEGRWQRLDRLTRAASQQCQRGHLPKLHAPRPFAEILDGQKGSLRLFFWEEAETSLRSLAQRQPSAGSVTAIVGPEGGFSENEVEQAARGGCEIVSLGPNILRAETAAIVALSLCRFAWS